MTATKRKHTIAVLNGNGHDTVEFCPDEVAEVEKAEKAYKEYERKGWAAFQALSDGQMQQLLGFEPDVESTVFLPPMVGG